MALENRALENAVDALDAAAQGAGDAPATDDETFWDALQRELAREQAERDAGKTFWDTHRPVTLEELPQHVEGIRAPYAAADVPLEEPEPREAIPGEVYFWKYFAPDEEDMEAPDEPLFLVLDDLEEPDEYGVFNDFAYRDFGLVDVMAFSFEPKQGQSVEKTIELLRADPRMREEPRLRR